MTIQNCTNKRRQRERIERKDKGEGRMSNKDRERKRARWRDVRKPRDRGGREEKIEWEMDR